MIREPQTGRDELQAEAEAHYSRYLHNSKLVTWLAVTVVEPFAEFFRRNGASLALSILSFVFLFKIGEAFLGRMSITFIKRSALATSKLPSIPS
ncbi:hypothetical protein PCI56_22820 [Plesiomonas shigelloides subsp. oncorhynchi]|nr:hypothetical protein [Plesiomonas shigelloides]